MLVVVCWKGFRTSGRVPSLGKVLRRAEGFGRRVLVRENRLRKALLGKKLIGGDARLLSFTANAARQLDLAHVPVVNFIQNARCAFPVHTSQVAEWKAGRLDVSYFGHRQVHRRQNLPECESESGGTSRVGGTSLRAWPDWQGQYKPAYPYPRLFARVLESWGT